MSLTVGVDLASQNKKTALCVIDWGEMKLTRLEHGIDDHEILSSAKSPGVTKLAIDAPLGWPEPFVDAVAAHHAGEAFPVKAGDVDGRKAFHFRQTDLAVIAGSGKRPLSVSTDKIAYIALRAAGILHALGERDPSDARRDGSGLVVEVYPGAALARWKGALGGASTGYKGRGSNVVRERLVAALFEPLGLHVEDDDVRRCRDSDDAFDAVVSAVIARTVERHLCDPIPAASREIALREGWIHLPAVDALSRLQQ